MAIVATPALRTGFFEREAEQVARDLLGRSLCRRTGMRSVLRGRIVETEAYLGEFDLASHARFGPTPRNRMMYERGGALYVYLIYGMHHCLNIVTGRVGKPQAVLLRAVELAAPTPSASGPGRLCRAFEVDRQLDGERCRRGELWFEQGDELSDSAVGRTSRIGVEYAGEWAGRQLRFIVRGSSALSGPRRLNRQSSAIR